MTTRIGIPGFILLALLLCGMGRAEAQSGIFQTHLTEHFAIRYEKNTRSDIIAALAATLEKSYTTHRKKLGISFERKIPVHVFNTLGRFKTESRTKVFTDGAYRDGKIFIHNPLQLQRDGFLPDVAARTVARALIEEIRFCPAWLAEAYGLYAGNAMTQFGQPARFNLASFEDLAEDFNRSERDKDLRELYAKLAATIHFLVTRYSERKIERIFIEFKGGVMLKEVFERAFNEELPAIERAWLDALRRSDAR